MYHLHLILAAMTLEATSPLLMQQFDHVLFFLSCSVGYCSPWILAM
jgi:hypothetical protein